MKTDRNILLAGLQLLLVGSLVLGLPTNVPAEPMAEGMTALSKKNYKKGFQLLKPLAEQGSYLAQFKLGELYRDGHGVPQNNVEAYKWFGLAARNFPWQARDMVQREVDSLEQILSPTQIQEAQVWVDQWQRRHRARLRGPQVYTDKYEEAVAAFNDADYEKAVRLSRLLAEQGDGRAQKFLGLLYARGQGIQRNYVQAYKWLSLSLVRTKGVERENSLLFLKNYERVMTPDQIKTAQKLARQWKPKTRRTSGP